jgi:topoisomerase IV subunit A
LRQWLDHRRAVLLRRSRHRLAAIERRLEMLAGMVVVFLNLDEVIRIIREEDDPKASLIAKFKLSEAQVTYILDTRLRALRRLEEMELKREQTELQKEKAAIEKLLGDEKQQWKTVAYQINDTKKKYGPDTKIGKRRTSFEAAPDVIVADLNEALIEREPVTIVVSQKGWIRALKGNIEDLSTLAFKGDDSLKASFPAETISKILVVATNGKVFTLDASKLPGGRGHGEPIRLMADIDEGADIATVLLYRPGAKAIIAATDGRGFVVGHDDMLSSTRKGRAVLIVDTPAEAKVVAPAEGDHIAVIGDNRKMLIFPIDQAPEMARGKGVRLQRYKDGGLSDARVFTMKEGLTWRDSSQRLWTVEAKELKDWIGNRAEAGRLPPKGFPRNNKFG